MKKGKLYNSFAKKYHKVSLSKKHFWNEYLDKPSLVKLIPNINNKKVLDLGCGSGRYTSILLKRGAKVWGIDPSSKLLEIAKQENPSAKFELGVAEKLPYPSNFFDVIVSGLVVDHVKDFNKLLKEVNRVLKNKGIFIFSMFNPIVNTAKKTKDNTYIFNNYFKENKRMKYWPSFGVNMPGYHRTYETIIKAIVKNGFIIEDYVDSKPIPSAKKLFPNEYRMCMEKPYFSVFKIKKAING